MKKCKCKCECGGKMKVYLDVAPVGQAFGCVGVVRRVGTRRKVAVCDNVVPYGFTAAALDDAYKLAVRRGWEVVDDRNPSDRE